MQPHIFHLSTEKGTNMAKKSGTQSVRDYFWKLLQGTQYRIIKIGTKDDTTTQY